MAESRRSESEVIAGENQVRREISVESVLNAKAEIAKASCTNYVARITETGNCEVLSLPPLSNDDSHGV